MKSMSLEMAVGLFMLAGLALSRVSRGQSSVTCLGFERISTRSRRPFSRPPVSRRAPSSSWRV